MITLKAEFSHIEAGEPHHFRNLTLFPLFRRDVAVAEPEYLLLEEAIGQVLARVTEIGGGGSVPELRFENNAERPTLLLDGEELIGAKQNRVLNLTVLAPAKQTTVTVGWLASGNPFMTLITTLQDTLGPASILPSGSGLKSAFGLHSRKRRSS